MKICVYGLWHLGTVTASCVADFFDVVGCDPSLETIQSLQNGIPPVYEPGLAEKIKQGISRKSLRFSSDFSEVLKNTSILWVTFDTPVDENDQPQSEKVLSQIKDVFPHLEDGVLVLISSQVPVGFTRHISQLFKEQYPNRNVEFAYSPENLRLGSALNAFCKPERIVVGIQNKKHKQQLENLFAPFCQRVEWMTIESAEMTKHALNAFLASSVVFANEIALICERTGADAREVERGLKSDIRIGTKAYLRPGTAFAGGTLARDVHTLRQIGNQWNLNIPLLKGILDSNQKHLLWTEQKAKECLETFSGKTVAVLGLSYKPNSNTLRRSASLELCQKLHTQGVKIQAYDPAIESLPSELSEWILLKKSAHEALRGSDLAIIMTDCSEFRQLTGTDFCSCMKTAKIIDPNRFLEKQLDPSSLLCYIAIGKGIIPSA